MKVLIVDDNEDARLILKKILEADGHTVEVATNGEEALKVARQSPPDMIISDILMPVMDGYLFCKEVKEDDKLKHIPFVFHTSTYTSSEDKKFGLGLGADRIIIKPVTPDEFMRIIQDVIGDVKEGRIKPKEPSLKEDKEIFKLYSERLIKKLESKNLDLEKEIIERKLAEETIRKSEEHHRMILQTAMDGFWLVDMQGRLLEVNEAYCRMSKYSKEELLVMSISDLEAVETSAEIAARIQKVLTQGEDRFESQHRRKDGSIFDVEISIQYRSIESGMFTVFMRDITATRKTAEEKERLEAQLRQAQKMEAVGTLAGGIAHDFNNILTIIIGYAEIALMNVGKNDSLQKGIKEIKAAGDRAAALTSQLLAFSRKQVIQPKILDLNELLTGIDKMLVRLIGEDVEILTIPEPALWQVKIDPGQMEQVIMNLVINARDAMHMGGKLTIETANMDLDENYFRKHGIKEELPGTYVMLAVSDTGIGMDKETQERIFEPFFTTKDIGKGTGLGLSTVYGIAKQNKGFIWVYSEPGQGTTFKIYLPKVKEGVEPEEKERTPIEELGGSETVFIVEDDDSLRKLARTVLKQKGYKVLEAENGEDALRVSEAHDGMIDLLITDVVMPKMGGKEIAERLQPLYSQMKVIYMSGYTDSAIAHHGVLAPGLNFIEKPFSPKVLVRKVREVLDE